VVGVVLVFLGRIGFPVVSVLEGSGTLYPRADQAAGPQSKFFF
jgi:hypothetical protein